VGAVPVIVRSRNVTSLTQDRVNAEWSPTLVIDAGPWIVWPSFGRIGALVV
jgi:hypothetical protein